MAFKFPDQHPGENVLMVIRKHFIVYFGLILGFSVIVVAPSIGSYFLINFYGLSQSSPLLSLALTLAILMYLLFGMVFLLIAWLKEAHDVFILTDQRLIDVTQITFFERTVATTPLDQIQDTTSHTSGIMQTILNYGNVDVQTAAGEASSFFIDRVPDPSQISRIILQEAQQHKDVSHIRENLMENNKISMPPKPNNDSEVSTKAPEN